MGVVSVQSWRVRTIESLKKEVFKYPNSFFKQVPDDEHKFDQYTPSNYNRVTRDLLQILQNAYDLYYNPGIEIREEKLGMRFLSRVAFADYYNRASQFLEKYLDLLENFHFFRQLELQPADYFHLGCFPDRWHGDVFDYVKKCELFLERKVA